MKAGAQPRSQGFSEKKKKKKKKKPGEGTGPLEVNALNFESEGPGSCFAVVLFP